MRSRTCHQCGHLNRGGAAYCGKCGQRLTVKNVWKISAGAAAVLALLIYAVVHLRDFAADRLRDFSLGGSPPELAVTFNTGGFFRTIQIVSHDDRPVVVQRVVINNKEGDPDCDFLSQTASAKDKASDPEADTDADPKSLKNSDPEAFEWLKHLSDSPLPARLTLGDSVSIIASRVCNDPVKVAVYTQLGNAVYDFH